MAGQAARLEPQAGVVVLDSLLAQYPDAFVAAADPGPTGLFVRIPPTIVLRGQSELPGRNALDLVIPADRVVIVDSWEQARANGIARAAVHLNVHPDAVAAMHFVDVRVPHGVFAVVVVPENADGLALAMPAEIPTLTPRVGRARKDTLAVFLDVDEATLRILGWTREEMVGRRAIEFIHPDDQERAIRNWMQMLEAPELTVAVRVRHRRADGGWTWFEVTNRNRLADAERSCVESDMVDISDEMAAQEALRLREKLLHRLAEALPIGVLQITPDRRVVYTNERLHAILGTPLALTADELLATVGPDDWSLLDAALAASLRDGIDADLEVQVCPTGQGRSRRCMLRLRSLADERGGTSGAVLTVEDVTESAQLRQELEQRATHDMLTRLLNRDSVIAALEAALARPKMTGTAVIFVDLDDFKLVNDQRGHSVGDELLRTVADRLAITVRAGDALGRIGGDEFLIVCPVVGGTAAAIRIADRVADALNRKVHVGGQPIDLRASIGLAYSGRRGITADAIVKRADAAMYVAKRRGDGRPVRYAAGMSRDAGANRREGERTSAA